MTIRAHVEHFAITDELFNVWHQTADGLGNQTQTLKLELADIARYPSRHAFANAAKVARTIEQQSKGDQQQLANALATSLEAAAGNYKGGPAHCPDPL